MNHVAAQIKRACRSYDAFQLIVLGVANGLLALAILTRGRAQLSRAYGNEAVWTAAEYCITYWLSNWRLGIGLVVALVLILGFDVLRQPFYRLFRTPLFPAVEGPTYLAKLRRFRVMFKLCFCALLVGAIPLLHLRLGTWYPVLLNVFIPVPVLALYVCVYSGQIEWRRPKAAVARHTFPIRSYNVAGVAHWSEEAQREVAYYERLQERWEYLLMGDSLGETVWKGHNAFIEKIAGLLGVDKEALRLFGNTTDAIEHALRECAGSLPRDTDRRVILTTDTEYGSVKEKIYELAARYKGTVHTVNIRDSIWQGCKREAVERRLCEAMNEHVGIVCLSHVCHESGFVMPIEGLLGYIGDLDHGIRPFVVVDGAQAAGHVRLAPEMLYQVHFFATSGHKWLLGQETLGILYKSRNGVNPKVTKELAVSGSLSRWAPLEELRKESAATIAAAPRLTLNASLCDITAVTLDAIIEHDADLASRFREQIEAHPAFRVVPIRSDSGVCIVEVDNAVDLARRLRRAGFVVGCSEGPSGGAARSAADEAETSPADKPEVSVSKERRLEREMRGMIQEARAVVAELCDVVAQAREHPREALRVCFHYYHSENDVDSLVHAMREEVDLTAR